MKKNLIKCFFAIIVFALIGCASVDITKTAKGSYSPTNPNDVDILMTLPQRKYVELGSVTVTNFDPTEDAKMHNALRAKAAGLGANAVVIQNQGIGNNAKKWAMGVAIRYE